MCDPILVSLLKMLPHYNQYSRENATPSSGSSPLASYKEVPPPHPPADRFGGSGYEFVYSTAVTEISGLN